MPRSLSRGKLAHTFLGAFLGVSLIPLLAAAYYLINISEESLKLESQRIQESLAVGFADTTWNYVTTYKNILLELSHLEEFTRLGADSGLSERRNQYLTRIMQLQAAITEVSVFDISGREVLRKRGFLAPESPRRNFAGTDLFQIALQKGDYVGGLERFQGSPTLTMAVRIVEPNSEPPRPVGVLMAKVSMYGLSNMLAQEFPENGVAEAAVVGSDGFLIAHSRPRFIYRSEAKLPKQVTDVILTQSNDKGSGQIPLPDGKELLGAFARIRELDWVVYVGKPLESAYEAAGQVRHKIYWVIGGIIPIVILLSFAISEYVTQPVRLLREAAAKLGQGQFDDLPEMVLTNDEIGDLAQTFLGMAESLKQKNDELVRAKEEVEKLNKSLERRVETRTRELKAAQDELINKERLAAIGQMASVVGHEIRNPLAVISNSTYFIKTKLSSEGATPDPKIAKHLSYIESEIRQANSIIDEILTFSRSRALKPVVLSINQFLEDILAVHPFPSHIQVIRELDVKNPVVCIDPEEMRQAVRNLIGNAVEIMPNGGALKVATEVVNEHWVRVDIGDTGPGIPPEVLEKIFNPFFTTKARGTGLGLAVVRKVVDRHQGKVDVSTAMGKGTIFKIFIPLAAKSASALPAEGKAPIRP